MNSHRLAFPFVRETHASDVRVKDFLLGHEDVFVVVPVPKIETCESFGPRRLFNICLGKIAQLGIRENVIDVILADGVARLCPDRGIANSE